MVEAAADLVSETPRGTERSIAAPRRDAVYRLAGLVRLVAKYGVLLAFVDTIVAFSLARPDTFPTLDNLKSILETAAPAAVVAPA